MIKNRKQYYWVFVILFVPVIGGLIYIFTQVVNSRDVSTITEGVTNIINPTKKIIDLENQLKFSDTFQNRVDLADAYLEIGDCVNAIEHYNKALDGNFSNDVYTINQLIYAYFFVKDFQKVVEYSEKIKSNTEFRKSQYFYGVALDNLAQFEEAEVELQKTDLNYSNYEERLYFAEFLIRRDKKEEAKEVLQRIITESENMTSPKRRKYRDSISKAQQFFNEI